MGLRRKDFPSTAILDRDLKVKPYLHVGHTNEDDLITDLILRAEHEAENLIGGPIRKAVYWWFVDAFPGGTICLEPPIWPLHPDADSETSIAYTDEDGGAATIDNADLQVDPWSKPGRIAPAYDETWPTARAVLNAVKVIAPFGWEDAQRPPVIDAAILWIIGANYAHRKAGMATRGEMVIPDAADRVLSRIMFWDAV